MDHTYMLYACVRERARVQHREPLVYSTLLKPVSRSPRARERFGVFACNNQRVLSLSYVLVSGFANNLLTYIPCVRALSRVLPLSSATDVLNRVAKEY